MQQDNTCNAIMKYCKMVSKQTTCALTSLVICCKNVFRKELDS